jgi:hypothetical protein
MLFQLFKQNFMNKMGHRCYDFRNCIAQKTRIKSTKCVAIPNTNTVSSLYEFN